MATLTNFSILHSLFFTILCLSNCMTAQTKDPEKNVFASLIHSYLYKFLYRRFSLQGVFYHLSRCLVVLHKRQVAILYCLSRKLKETKPYIILTIIVPLSLTLTI